MANSDQILLYQIALTLLPGVGSILAKNLLAYCGSPEAVFHTPKAKLCKVPAIGEERAELIVNAEVLQEAEQELKFIEQQNITPLFFTDAAYPKRLRDCSNSPLLLYYRGNTSLNEDKVLGIVGTRRATTYGKEMTKKLLEALVGQNILIVSGLAYGIDIAAHQAALDYQMNTVAVLGHGLNNIYPSQHKSTANKMIEQGGLLTEYRSTEKIAQHNFANRNRIVAGMCDALVVVETADDGGAVITANLASTYNRDVFAIPGRTTDKFSRGCHTLIKTNRAQLIESGQDLLKAMNWDNASVAAKPKKPQRELLLDLSTEERKVYDILTDGQELEIDLLAAQTNIGSSRLASVLLDMEMNDLVVSLPGKRYKLL